MPIADFAVRRRVTVAMLAIAIVVLGVFALPRLPIDLLPSFQPPVVTVSITYGNVSPETMEATVTRPIENAVARVAGIDFIQSNSYQGQSVVRAQFKFGTNIDIAAVDIQQQVARAQSTLPNDPNLSQPQIIKADPNSIPIGRFYVTDTGRTQRSLADLFTNTLSDEFAAIGGVGSVNVGGAQTRAIMVEPNQQAIAANHLSNADIISRIASENVDDPAGIISIGPQEFAVRTNALYRSAADVGETVVAVKNGVPVYLRDVADVRDSIEEQRIFSRADGVPGISLIVTAQPDANAVAVSNDVLAKIHELERRYPTMHFTTAFEQAGFITEAVNALEHTAALGAVLAVLIILLFLHSWRSTLIVAISLPVSVMGTLFATYLFHQTLNTMTLGGLALAVGLIVDDAVVVTENIFRHLDEGQSPLDAARSATAQILSAVLSSTITVVTVFVPLLLIPGLQGLIFGPFALTVMTGVATSFLVAVTTVPMLSSLLLRPSDAHVGSRFARRFDAGYVRIERWYRGVLAGSLDRPALVLGIGIALFAITILALRAGAVATETFPAADSRFARFFLRTPNGTSLAVTSDVARLVEAAVARDPRVESVGVDVGSTFGGGTILAVTNEATFSITLRRGVEGPKATAFVRDWQSRLGARARGAAPQALAQNAAGADPALRKALIGTSVFVRTIDILQQVVSQGQDALQIQIYGPDVGELYRLAQDAIPKLATIRGVTRPDTNITASQPEVDVRIDRRKAVALGFNTGQIAADVATATSGTIASYFQTNGVQYPIFVEAPPAQRRSYAALSSLPLVTPASGATIPLSAVATITQGVGPSQISRQDKERRIDIDAPVIGRPLGDVLAEATQIMDSYPLPSGYRWQYGPAITQNNDTFSALALVVALAIVLIYMLLASQFESLVDPLIIMVSVPFALTGIVGSLVVTGRAFGLTAFIGSLMLVGIAVKNAILVVEFTKQLRRGGLDTRAALLVAAPRRLRPILMTTVATIGGMLPLAIGIEAGSSTQAPLGTVVIGGLVTSTVLSLVIVPTLYLLVSDSIDRRKRARINPGAQDRPPVRFEPVGSP